MESLIILIPLALILIAIAIKVFFLGSRRRSI